jgi:hypothetical protein
MYDSDSKGGACSAGVIEFLYPSGYRPTGSERIERGELGVVELRERDDVVVRGRRVHLATWALRLRMSTE